MLMTDRQTGHPPTSTPSPYFNGEVSLFVDSPEDNEKLAAEAARLRGLVEFDLSAEAIDSLVAKLKQATLMSRTRRQRQQSVNANYLRNPKLKEAHVAPPPDATAFSGTEEEIANFMKQVAEVAEIRFAEETYHNSYRDRDHIAFDIGHLDQFGDWDAPSELDALVAAAVDQKRLSQIDGVNNVEVVVHDRDHPHIAYEFQRCVGEAEGWYSCLASRKRPIADVTFQLGDHDPVTVDIFRHSSFLMNAHIADHDGLYNVLWAAEHVNSIDPGRVSQRMLEKREGAERFLSNMLVQEDRDKQAFVIPCSIGYIVRIRDPKYQSGGLE